jgi:hypothetical protein
MEASRRRRNAPLPLQREFTGSRLEKQILMRALDLVTPARRLDRMPEEQPTTQAGRPPIGPRRSPGA